MISRIRGTLVRRDLSTVEVLTNGGVAYELHIPLTVFERLPRGPVKPALALSLHTTKPALRAPVAWSSATT